MWTRSPAMVAFSNVWLKPLTLAALIAPFLYLVLQFVLTLNGLPSELGFNPAEWTHRFLGDTALRILQIALAITPLREITGWGQLLRVRRRIGLAAFFYALLHIVAYLWFDLLWSMAALWEDVLKRTYITLGMAAVALMTPLALTSTNGMIRRLGAAAWRRLHWLVYPAAVLGVLHHIFMVKGVQPEPLVHAAILALLLGWRVWRRVSPKRSGTGPTPGAARPAP